jgi:predicted esterase
MKLKLVFLFCLITKIIAAQYCTNDDRFTEVDFFTLAEIDSTFDMPYGTAIDWQGNPVQLTLDIYYPTLSIDTMAQRPIVIMVHGGFYLTGTKESKRADCRDFAQKGFVAATIKYRLGYDQSVPTDVIQAAYRAQQDANAAWRTVVGNSSALKIDTSWMFMGGHSAGSGTTLNTQYASESEYESLSPGIVNLLGGLKTSGNNLVHSFTLKGIYNNWGSTVGIVQAEEMIPMVSFHGAMDQVVNIDSIAAGSYGSRVLHNLLSDSGVCTELTVDTIGGHGIYLSPEGGSFRRGRASCFFKSVFCNACNELYTVDSLAANCSSIVGNLDPLLTEDSIELFPNPVSDQFTVKGKLDNYTIQILDATGVNHQTITNFGSSFTLSTTSLPSGLYFIRILSTNNITIRTIIKD